MLERIRDAVSFAAEHGITVAYFGVDGTRADPEFFDEAYETAVEAGAKEVGRRRHDRRRRRPRPSRSRRPRALGLDVPVHFHGHNDFGLATAAAVAAVRAGARWIQGTINGMGERAGNANLVEVALHCTRSTASRRTSASTASARSRELVRELSGYELEPWKPLVGENLFRRESGAVASQFHDPPAIEPYSSELVGAERSVVLGKKSGIDSIRIEAEELGLDVPEERSGTCSPR